jgi:CheY-like chemotaxis protein
MTPPAASVPSRPDEGRPRDIARSVLVVEDEVDIRETLAEILEVAGYDVDAVASGTEAIAQLERRAYDVIVSDLRMPGMNGMDLFRRVREDHGALSGRFVLVTGDRLDGMLQAFLAESLVPVLAKPFAPSDVRRIVADVSGGPRRDR